MSLVQIYAGFYLPLSLKLIRDGEPRRAARALPRSHSPPAAWVNLPDKESGERRTIPPDDTLANFFFTRGGEATLIREGESVSMDGLRRDKGAPSM